MRRADVVLRTIEAAYAPMASDASWLEGIVDALGGLGLGPWNAYIREGRTVPAFAGISREWQVLIRRAMRSSETVMGTGHAPAPPLVVATRKWKQVTAGLGMTIRGLEDLWGYTLQPMIALLGTNARGNGVLMGMMREVELAPRTRRSLCLVAAHVAAAHRLRSRLQEAAPEAICSPVGELLDGSHTAVACRDSLAAAVKDMDSARGKLRRLEPEEAAARWTAMVDGRWTLVDRSERDGKRLVLAYRNDPACNVGALRGAEGRVATFAALGHSNKYIAYELGLAPTTVATHLQRALRKLKVADRRELALVFGPLARLTASRDGRLMRRHPDRVSPNE